MSAGPWTGQAAALAERIGAFVDGSLRGAPPEPFEGLALDVFRWQAANDPVARALADREVSQLADIPAVPVSLFKDLHVGTVGADAPVTFRTSGTTGGGRGAHRMRTTALYDRGALAWADRCVPGRPASIVALLEDPATAPDSSLSHMVALFGAPSWHVRGGELDVDGVSAVLAADARAGRPVFVASTAFALAAWLGAGPGHKLPSGSVIMVTGGFKGRAVTVDEDGLFAWVRAVLAPARIVTEYGMTELSSQLWATPGTPYLPPPWLRPVAVDPASGVPVPAGERGLLRFYDLCNLDGALGVETMDLGVVGADGAVTLAGRMEGAPARGCSLTVEQALAKGSPGGMP